MAARDRFTITVRCPQCGASGDARVSEDDYPHMSSPRFRVDLDAPGFFVSKHGSTQAETQFTCATCRTVAE